MLALGTRPGRNPCLERAYSKLCQMMGRAETAPRHGEVHGGNGQAGAQAGSGTRAHCRTNRDPRPRSQGSCCRCRPWPKGIIASPRLGASENVVTRPSGRTAQTSHAAPLDGDQAARRAAPFSVRKGTRRPLGKIIGHGTFTLLHQRDVTLLVELTRQSLDRGG